MVHDPLSTLLIGRLTRLLDLNCLEELKALEECGYVKQNIELQTSDDDFNRTAVYETQQVPAVKSTNQLKTIFRSLSRKEEHHAYGLVIPRVKLEAIVQLIDFLKTDVGAEGLFRISGNKKRQLELKNVIQKGKNINLGVEELPYNMHDIAGILKEFFGNLEEPLLTKQLYDCYQQLADMDSEVAHKRKLETLRTLFLLLPPLNRFLLKKLIELLAVVADDPNNKMDAYNLGVVFAPNIICTRQVSCSTEFTENMEPFTDLMKFIIENSSEVFQIPEDFLEEANAYMKKIDSDEEKTGDVPMTKTFCHRIDSKEYRKEAQDNTNQAITMLYAQILEMPDGTKKNEFLSKFYQSYPGTPMFIPKTMRNALSTSFDSVSSPRTPNSFRGDITDGCSIGGRSSERLIYSPLSKHDVETTTSTANIPSSHGAKFKHCLKRVRRTSQEILNPKSSKIPPPGDQPMKSVFANNQPMKSVENDSRCTKVKNKLQSYKKSALKSLRRSLSSPTLIIKPKGSSSSEDSCDDMNPRELFRDDSSVHKSMELISCDDGSAKTSSNNLRHHEGRAHKSMDELSSDDARAQKCVEKLSRNDVVKLSEDDRDTTRDDRNISGVVGDEHKSLNELEKCEIKIWFPCNALNGINNLAINGEQDNYHNDNVTPAIRKSLYPCARKMVVKEPIETPEITIVKTPVICKRDVLSRGVPLVNLSLTLENMRKVHERKLLAGKLTMGKQSLLNDASRSEKENMVSECLRCDESSTNGDKIGKISSKDIIEPMSDITNVNLNKFRYISLQDCHRSDATESITKKVGLLNHISIDSSSEIKNLSTNPSLLTTGRKGIEERHETRNYATSDLINKLYNKQLITFI